MKVSLPIPLRPRANASKWLVATLLLTALLSGCRNNSSQREIFIRELRQQEDEIYQLEDYVEEYQAIICQKREENARLQREIEELRKQQLSNISGEDELPFGGAARERATERRPIPAPRRNGAIGEPDGLLDPGLPEIDLGDPVMPEIDLGEPIPSEEISPPSALPEEIQGALPLPTRTQLASATIEEVEFVPPPRPVEPADSVALYAEQAPTESRGDVKVGLLAIVEPLRRDGSAGEFHGPLSLMVIDPIAGEGNSQLVRWDLTEEQVEQAWRDGSRRVLDFALALPDDAPVGRPLELWVRLLTQQGDKILSHTTIELAPPIHIIGTAASGIPSRLEPGDDIVQTLWVAAAPVAGNITTEDVAAWRATNETPPAAVAAPRTTTPTALPAWSPNR